MQTIRVFLLDDHEIVRRGLRDLLEAEEDISVVGIDDHPLAALADLTTVAQPVLEQGEMVGQMVIDTLAGRSVAEGRTVPTRLVVRGTTARPRGAA